MEEPQAAYNRKPRLAGAMLTRAAGQRGEAPRERFPAVNPEMG